VLILDLALVILGKMSSKLRQENNDKDENDKDDILA